MRIKSTFTDCYDHFAKIYGEDEKIVYDRRELAPEIGGNLREVYSISHQNLFIETDLVVPIVSGYDTKENALHKTLFIAGKRVTLIRRIFEEESWSIDDEAGPNRALWYGKKKRHDLEVTEDNVKFMKLVGHPVFCVEEARRTTTGKTIYQVSRVVPKLSDYKITKLISAQVIYQDIVYALTNLLNESPDAMPTAKLSDKEKVLSHGFDLKQSFRHRK